jgi:hypothetical protein
MPLEIAVIERRPVPDGQRFWDTVARILSRATRSTAAKMQARAPHGKSGKLSRRVDVRVTRINQGFVQGVEADFIVAVRYGHLVARGHRIVARDAQRKGLRLSKGERATRRSALLERRGRGSLGFVPANPFAAGTLQEDQGSIVQAIEDGLTNAV